MWLFFSPALLLLFLLKDVCSLSNFKEDMRERDIKHKRIRLRPKGFPLRIFYFVVQLNLLLYLFSEIRNLIAYLHSLIRLVAKRKCVFSFVLNTRFHSVNCACTISEESTRSVLKAVGKLCKLMKALTVRFLHRKK